MNKFKKRMLAVGSVVILLALLVIFRSPLKSGFEAFMGNDYPGPGSGEVTILIENGETGETITQSLVDAGVVKDYSFTYKLMISRNDVYVPGTFTLLKQMSSADALDRLIDTKYQLLNRVTIREGLRIGQVFSTLSEATGLDTVDFKAVTLEQLGLPKTLPSLEGYLFPATYGFAKSATAKEILGQMVERMNQELDHYGVPKTDRHKVLTLASIIQKEARKRDDFYKVSRVFTNRIDQGMLLQSDATVSYGSNGTTVTTTDAERADKNGYNTYVHVGLPVGPISAPGSTAIDAALHPAKGQWLYFCAVNLETGETVFSNTMAEHEKAVALWRAWMRENLGWNG